MATVSQLSLPAIRIEIVPVLFHNTLFFFYSYQSFIKDFLMP